MREFTSKVNTNRIWVFKFFIRVCLYFSFTSETLAKGVFYITGKFLYTIIIVTLVDFHELLKPIKSVVVN